MAITEDTLRIAARTRARLREMTDAQILELTRAWVLAWDSLAADFEAAILELLAAAKDGRVPVSVVTRNVRLRDALQQARRVLDELSTQTANLTTSDVAAAMLDAMDSHPALLQSQLPAGQAGAQMSFARVSPEALAAMVERMTEQIHTRTLPLAPDVERLMKSELYRGIAVGDNPRRTASRIVRRAEGRFNGGLTRALTIARTETLDAHREANRQSRLANKDMVTGWYWTATLDARTCPSCLANHGSLHPVDEFGPIDHHNGRCDAVDKVKSWRELGFDIDEPEDLLPDAREWFDGLTEDTQRAIMGPERLRLLQDGEIGWDDLTRRAKNGDWRDSMQVAPVKDLRPVA